VQDIARDQISQAVKASLRERHNRLSEGDIAASLEALKSGGMMDKWLWRKTLSRLYKDEERLKIELQVIDFIKIQTKRKADESPFALSP
jgi:hypothetical protein